MTTFGFEKKGALAALLLVVGCGGGSKPANAPVDGGADAAPDGAVDTGTIDGAIDVGIETTTDTPDDVSAPVDTTDAAAADTADATAGETGAGDGSDGGGRPAILVVATYLGGISSFRIGPMGELLPATSSLDSGAQLYGVVAHPSGDFVYATDFRGRIYSYRVNRDDGSLADLSAPLMIGGAAVPAAIDPQGRFLYVGAGDNSLYVYAIDPTSGALNPIPHSPFVLGFSPAGLCFHPSGGFLFVSSTGIHVFKIDPTSGAAQETEHSPFATTIFGGALVAHPNGNFLYDGAFGVHVLSIDPTSRDLTELADSPHPGAQSDNQAIDVAVDPMGQLLYAVSSIGTVTAYRLNADGAFGPVDSSPFDGHTLPYSVAIDPTGQFVYVGNDDADQVSAYSIERPSGKLQPLMTSPFTVNGLQPEIVIIGS